MVFNLSVLPFMRRDELVLDGCTATVEGFVSDSFAVCVEREVEVDGGEGTEPLLGTTRRPLLDAALDGGTGALFDRELGLVARGVTGTARGVERSYWFVLNDGASPNGVGFCD